MSEAKTFEENLGKLEELVSQLEQGELPLDKALGVYEDGLKKLQLCRDFLAQTEVKLTQLQDKYSETA